MQLQKKNAWNYVNFRMLTGKRLKYFFILMGILALLLLPYSLLNGNIFVCIFKDLTDHDCPLCGMTRACYHMVRFQSAEAFSYNPLALFFPVLMGIEILNDVAVPGMHRIRRILWTVFLVAVVVLFLFRII